jgi:hypothetical protein
MAVWFLRRKSLPYLYIPLSLSLPLGITLGKAGDGLASESAAQWYAEAVKCEERQE